MEATSRFDRSTQRAQPIQPAADCAGSDESIADEEVADFRHAVARRPRAEKTPAHGSASPRLATPTGAESIRLEFFSVLLSAARYRLYVD